ncbi:MAG: hypothetical protein HKN11_03655 [Rhizobiales bacterium]|nr:hypothetical protein [Hyphomicrobiales bacterium]
MVGWLMLAAGLIGALAELLLAVFLSGYEIADAVIYENGRSSPEIAVEIRREDMPVRINLMASGATRKVIRSISEKAINVKLHLGNGSEPRSVVFQPRTKVNTSAAIKFNTIKSIMLADQPAGIWRLSLDVRTGSRVRLEKISMAVRTNARAINMTLIAFLGVFAALGLAIGLVGRKLGS